MTRGILSKFNVAFQSKNCKLSGASVPPKCYRIRGARHPELNSNVMFPKPGGLHLHAHEEMRNRPPSSRVQGHGFIMRLKLEFNKTALDLGTC